MNKTTIVKYLYTGCSVVSTGMAIYCWIATKHPILSAIPWTIIAIWMITGTINKYFFNEVAYLESEKNRILSETGLDKYPVHVKEMVHRAMDEIIKSHKDIK